ncbi:Dyp-type peroxidase [Geodermatophilus sp. YIM 151500]|uniref:Dyp-type peroxidase n=1 Tax=Geodermatophilus sp. YIM 151500 TaxID=2984531 RepID=UPI0021E47B1B|nr:Dyp-type peroxidase [Geodermatophilus sp. YIM 151500]MCV2487999.1 Dyp-type peroxidase [Geodermatophilus sp. YIM 151500]
MTTTTTTTPLDLADVQGGILNPRPSPYVGTYLLLRIDDRRDGREMLRRLAERIAPAATWSADSGSWFNVALSHRGLAALGVPAESLATFPPEFRAGMAARAGVLGDVGVQSPEHWEWPLGTADVHVALAVIAKDAERLDVLLEEARAAYGRLPGVRLIWRQDCYALPTEREAFGFRDGISHPAVEGSGIPGSNPQERPLEAGEFVTGYVDETGDRAPVPQPEALGRNGTYVVFRKLHQDVAGFRRYLRDHSASAEDEERLAAKLVGRWRSGAPLVLAPERDDPALGADPTRNNDYLYRREDERGLRCPVGSHVRRMNPRDAVVTGEVRLHRMIRRGTSYGPPLPDGVLEDDGAERGLCFVFIGAHIARQFEFVQAQWVGDGRAFGAPEERDPLVGSHDGPGVFTIPARPIRRRLTDLPQFVSTRGGEYCFAPSLTALRWLADLEG